jgi:hypothetical protein
MLIIAMCQLCCTQRRRYNRRRHDVKPKELRCAAKASHDVTSVEDVIWRAAERGRIR